MAVTAKGTLVAIGRESDPWMTGTCRVLLSVTAMGRKKQEHRFLSTEPKSDIFPCGLPKKFLR